MFFAECYYYCLNGNIINYGGYSAWGAVVELSTAVASSLVSVTLSVVLQWNQLF